MVNQDDVKRGREAVKEFHNESIGYPGYTYSLDSLIQKIGGASPTIFLDGLGFGIASAKIDFSEVKAAMQSLARKSKGQIPRPSSFFGYLSNQSIQISYMSLASEVGSGVVSDIGKGAQAVGSQIIETGKLLTQFLPFIVIGVVGFVIYSNAKKLA